MPPTGSTRRRQPPAALDVEEMDGEFVLLSWSVAADGALAGFTEAEASVVRCLQLGLSNAEIARIRGTTPRTVANQIASILRKTGLASRYEIIRHIRGRHAGARHQG